jgi:hypothetical protein
VVSSVDVLSPHPTKKKHITTMSIAINNLFISDFLLVKQKEQLALYYPNVLTVFALILSLRL